MAGKRRFSFPYLAFSNLSRRPFRTVALMFLISILSFVLSAGSLVSMSLKNGTDSLSRRLGADLLIVPKGYEQRTKGVLLGGEPSTFYMDASWVEKISKIRGVRKVSPQLYVASLNADCCSSAVQIVGFRQTTDFTITPWVQSTLSKPLSTDEIVIGNSVSGAAGGKLRLLEKTYTVTAKMDRTGTGFDNSVFMNFQAARKAAEDYAAKTGGAKVPADVVSSIAVSVQGGYSAGDVRGNIYRALEDENSGVSVIASEEIVGGVSGSLRTTENFVVVLAALLWILSVFVLGIMFSVVLNERKREFGILRSLGATKKKLAAMVLLESAGVSLCGGALGTGLCILLILPLQSCMQDVLNMPFLQPSAVRIAAVTAASLLLSFAVGPISSLASVFRICKEDTVSVIREENV